MSVKLLYAMSFYRSIARSLAILTILSLFTGSAFATDYKHFYNKGQSLNIRIGQTVNYSIALIVQTQFGTTAYDPITGLGAVKTIAIPVAATLTLHVVYFDSSSNAKDPNMLVCGSTLKFSSLSHTRNCNEFNEAIVLIQPGK